jgi:hypothetical protein
MKVTKKTIVATASITIIAGVCAYAVIGYLVTNPFDRVNCKDWPTRETVDSALRRNKATVEALEHVSPGLVTVYTDADRCPGKGRINVIYDSESHRGRLQDIYNASQLRDIPVRFMNM